MEEQIASYVIFNTEMGWVGVAGSASGLARIVLPRSSEEEVLGKLGGLVKRGARAPHLFHDLVDRLKRYFSGQRVDFTDRLDFSSGTPFQRRVWETAMLIPYGETRSYGWIARQINQPKATRAVGQALGRNPFPVIVPCHRVLASDGELGGFSSGLELKRWLLDMESRNRT